MIQANNKKSLSALLGVGLAALLIWGWDNNPKMRYYHHQGHIFGTYYNIRYEAQADLENDIQTAFKDFDNSLSMFNPHSILSAINNNRDTTTDVYFENMWLEAERVHALSGGAFDVTVAPLVNYWGFGNQGTKEIQRTKDKHAIDSLMAFVGFDKAKLVDHRIIKSDQRVQIDGGAVAKGQACDVIAELLRGRGSTNYLVDIGGEVVAEGVNDKGSRWSIGISKPNLNNEGAQAKLQEVVSSSSICMATSGNYLNYYYANGERRSHTIDPRTGEPVQHSVLSATVVSSSCMRADAMATACMVLGKEEALRMIERAGDAACYLIVAENDSLSVFTSPNWAEMITK